MTETSISGLRGPKSMYFMEIVDVSSQESSVLSSIVESFTSAVSASNLGYTLKKCFDISNCR